MNISSMFYMNKTQHGPDSTAGQHTFHRSRVYLSILKGGDEHSDMNEFFHYKTPPMESQLHQWPANASAAFYINTEKNLVYLVDYAVYQLCMKQLHTRALGLGWKPNG